ncbi:acyl-CoA dehydrogenase family protein [Streptomyces pristinaespiralis]|uniref:Acyl CoA dehydrogenase n=2 Tax=Streptomyces pristinaespiralis TaxID=38300 RepID=B5H6T2_STRE2|nr:acyl-CoA dehydrogenase family protein [Streptomyces pristinaespiralis]ALC18711.1 acyl-CoA dehydrogenase [Streptomyces pristinaespiralis]EDY62543.1 acyl CoA dehydrogenase [Streptomyces pristinaespiralis ATCC 25486]QMU18126.1 acyl-CoA dehydrogenase family protein [Streptomyces pristinaespiralis]
MRRSVYNEDHEAFRGTIRDFIAKEVSPVFHEWEQAGLVPRELYYKLGDLGVFGIEVPEQFGGAGLDSYKYEAVIQEELARAAVTFGASGIHTGLCLGYLKRYATEDQMRRWMPGFLSGDTMYAIAMTEPGAGSDLAGIKTSARLSEDGTHWILNGAKTFITGGVHADRVLVVCRTSPAPAENRRLGLSLLVVDAHAEGFAVGRKLEKIGLRTSDTAELSFSDVKVPVEDLLGEEGNAFSYLSENLVVERLFIGISATASARAAIDFALEYTRQREVFGKSVASFQNTKFVLAECAAEVEAAQVMTDRALELHDVGALTAADAARLKLFTTEVAGRVIDKCLQLHGGYGYILEYPIARLYADTRVSRIYAGTNEVMKSVIAKDLGL